VTAGAQTAGRVRQGRSWTTPPGRALLMSLVVRRDAPPLPTLPLAVAVAVAGACGTDAMIKWPNDVLMDDRKVAGILVEGRPQHGWAVLGIGINVALSPEDLPEDLRATATGLGRRPSEIEPFLEDLLDRLVATLAQTPAEVLDAWRARDALRGRRVTWAAGAGVADGVDADGRLLVRHDDGTVEALNAGEVHLTGRD